MSFLKLRNKRKYIQDKKLYNIGCNSFRFGKN